MKIGLLWYGNSQPLEASVRAAALRFRDKFGLGWPDTCYVHPSALGKAEETRIAVIDDRPGADLDDGYLVPSCVVRVLPDPHTLPRYYWIGQKEIAP